MRYRLAALVVIALVAIGVPVPHAQQTPAPRDGAGGVSRPYLVEAQGAAKWLRNVAEPKITGLGWAATPGPKAATITNLYSGSAGVVLFFLELHHATGLPADLETARQGARALAAAIDSEQSAGLYTGLGGTGFVLTEVWKATKDQAFRDAANRALDRVKAMAKPVGDGVEWSPVSDIISGTAGIGLYLLYSARELNRPDAKELAEAAGRRLIAQQMSVDGGVKWAMTPANPTRLYPNFSHGTAGIAYFLATLAQETSNRAYRDAALAGTRYLLKVAKTEGDVCLVFHHEPEADGLDLYYLSWCHGPAGTARLFHRLATVTGEREWRDWIRKSANGIRKSGIPDQRTPGFWNNVGQCCGSVGVAEFFLSYHEQTRDKDALAFVRTLTAEITAKATKDDQGTRWIHAEHRVQPGNIGAQTGWMQGAAGIGAWYLRLDAFDRGKKPLIRFPDAPW
jgi:lantibiotic modifying enzyme